MIPGIRSRIATEQIKRIKTIARVKLAKWYNEVEESGHKAGSSHKSGEKLKKV